MQRDQREHLGKQAKSLPGAQVSSDDAGQRAQSRRCTHTALSTGRAATQVQQRLPSQAATEQVLLRGSLWRTWQQNPLLAAESMQSLFRGTRWSPSLSLHWRRSRELALTGAYCMCSYYCSGHEGMRTSTGPRMTPGTSSVLEAPGILSR